MLVCSVFSNGVALCRVPLTSECYSILLMYIYKKRYTIEFNIKYKKKEKIWRK